MVLKGFCKLWLRVFASFNKGILQVVLKVCFANCVEEGLQIVLRGVSSCYTGSFCKLCCKGFASCEKGLFYKLFWRGFERCDKGFFCKLCWRDFANCAGEVLQVMIKGFRRFYWWDFEILLKVISCDKVFFLQIVLKRLCKLWLMGFASYDKGFFQIVLKEFWKFLKGFCKLWQKLMANCAEEFLQITSMLKGLCKSKVVLQVVTKAFENCAEELFAICVIGILHVVTKVFCKLCWRDW